MTLSATAAVNRYAASEGQLSFPYSFKLLDETHLQVFVGATVVGSGYTVSGIGSDTGGNVSFTAAAAPRPAGAPPDTVTLRRNVPLDQVVDLPAQGSISSVSLEESGLDRIVMLAQQLAEVDERSLKIPVDSTLSGAATEVTPAAGALVGFDAAGSALTTYAKASLAASLLPTSLMESLLGDATVAEALATLGVAGLSPSSADTGRLPVANGSGSYDLMSGGLLQQELLVGGVFATNTWALGDSIGISTVPDNEADTYVLPAWVLLSDGNGIVDIDRDADGSLRATVRSAGKQFGFVQVIEAANCRQAIGGTVSFAVRAKAGGLSMLRLAVLSWTGTADAVTTDVVSAWAGAGTEPTWAANWTREGEIVDLDLQSGFSTALLNGIPIDTANAVQIAVVTWLDDTDAEVDDTLSIEFVSCRPGAVWTGPVRRDATHEALLCDRYARTIAVEAANATIGHGFSVTGSDAFVFIPLSPPMRAVPTLLSVATADFELIEASTASLGSPSSLNLNGGSGAGLVMLTIAVSGQTVHRPVRLADDGTGAASLKLVAGL